jgi:filamentous haemagglutinin family outer membrane protein
VVTTKPKSGDVPVTRPRKDVTPVQQLALPGPTSKPVSYSQVTLPHPMDKANYSQKTYSNNFSAYGSQKYSDVAGYEIKTVDDLAQAIKNKDVSVSDLPVEYINRDGNVLIQNTRTSQALTVAGVPRNQWHVTDNTGSPLYEKLLDEQLLRNKLTSEGISTVRRSGGTNNGK